VVEDGTVFDVPSDLPPAALAHFILHSPNHVQQPSKWPMK
jgi:hypothetical protein